MKNHLTLLSLTLFAAVAFSNKATAIPTATTLNFEGLPDSTLVGNAYSSFGVHFNHAIALTAGVSLNEIQFPPHSGSKAVTDDGLPMLITFDSPVFNISGFFAYGSLLTFTAFDGAGGLLGTAVSPQSSFLGNTELINLGFSGVSALQINSLNPRTYILDDLAFQSSPSSGSSVPDGGSTLPLLFFAGMAMFSSTWINQKKSNRDCSDKPNKSQKIG